MDVDADDIYHGDGDDLFVRLEDVALKWKTAEWCSAAKKQIIWIAEGAELSLKRMKSTRTTLENVVNFEIKCDLINNIDFLCSPTNMILYHYHLELVLVSFP